MKSWEGLFEVVLVGIQAGDQDGEAVTTKSPFQNWSQFWISVGDKLLSAAGVHFLKRQNNLSEKEQRFIDLNGFLAESANRAENPLRSRKINKDSLSLPNIPLVVDIFQLDSKNRMRPWRILINFITADHSIFASIKPFLNHLLSTVALFLGEILNNKLILNLPS